MIDQVPILPSASSAYVREVRHVYDGPAFYQNESRDQFHRLVQADPRWLIDLVESGTLRPSNLTFAAEILGSVDDRALVDPVLLVLLGHDSPLVREGAVYGLACSGSAKVRAQLQFVADNDPSPGVRRAAQEVLDN
ncbi:MAG: HEAT repeat domain-containing protein [Phycisphaerae bacterium]